LTGADRAAVEARLAADEDAYELLVGVMRTEDAMAPAPRRELRWGWMAGSVAAAAAAVVLAVRLLPVPASDDRLASLVTAVNGERYVEPRISGGFPAGPVRAATRGQDPSSTRGVGDTRGAGDLSSQNLALVAAVGQAQARAQAEPTAPNLHVLGVGFLLLGDRDQAIDTLESAAASESANARLVSDLAAAYAVRAAATASASDWSNALDRADRAIRLDESVVEAYFNRALALEALGLDSARAAWQSFLDRDSTSEWAREARAHLARLSERPQSRLREANEQAIMAALASGAGLDDAVRQDPQRTRELLEEDLSREWADAVVSGDAAAESRARMRGARLLAAYATVARDALPADALNHLWSRVVDRARVAAAIREYADAARLVREDRLAESSAALARALPVLQASGSPLAPWARYFIVLEWSQQGKLTNL
jgi:tetratricopeptide (TPR) repeat protein